MKIPVNLSSDPFRRDRPVLVASIAVGVMLTILLCVLVSLAISERNRAKEARNEMASVDAHLKVMSAEQSKLEAMMRRPENAEVLDRSQFINALLLRKGVSWTQIFNDLE